VFSKGGFVALPVVFAAWCWRTPVVAHESDLTPGLANRLCLPLVQQLCLGFSGSKQHPKHRHKYTVTGTPVRHTMLNGSAEQGRKLCGFHKEHPIVLVFGGSLGAQAINQTIEQARQEWSNQWQVIHISGQENNAPSNTQQYCHFSFVQDEFPHLLACADVVISRAGANTLAELVACRKPHVLIPLPLTVSRGDQIENASYFQEQGLSQVIPQDHLDSQSLLQAIEFCLAHHTDIKKRLQNYQDNHALPLILKILTLYAPSVEKADPTI
jgi:UDP-N-acetylglucosamine--N-acetylmuramyl-(pentapeptide) pyrophosphoryl-undecaprenol N-acetylglucosamine transferase